MFSRGFCILPISTNHNLTHRTDTARIVIRQEEHRIVVRVEDAGKGIPLEKQLEITSSGRTGIGVGGMRERLRQLRGDLDIRSDSAGTVVAATLPLPDVESSLGSQGTAIA